MAKEKIKVYTYTRVSTAMQIDGYSLDAQKSRMKAFAEFNDYEIAHEYEDAGKSGKSIEGRTQFNQMMEDIKTGKDGVSFVLVFKLSRFGRNAADVLSTLQVMQDFGVNLICVEDGIDSSKDAGKLMISVLSAVAEIERENIRVQTMEGRIQKAREGKWNGGFAPYGYKLVDGKLEINEEEAPAIRTIYEQYVTTDSGANGIAKYLENHGISKVQRQNGKNPLFDARLIRMILKNPVYCGKIAYGRRKTEKVHGTRNEYRLVEQENFLLVDGLHEAIIPEDVWQAAQVKLAAQAKRYEHVNKGKNECTHLLSGIVKCPVCGVGMYGNKCVKRKADGSKYKDFYYYGCKHRSMTRGHKCDYKKQIRKELLDDAVAEVICKLVSNPKFAAMMQEKINMKVDTTAIEQEISNYEKQLRQAYSTKSKLIEEIDSLDPDDRHYSRRKSDLDDRLYGMYDKIEELESLLIATRAKKQAIEAEKLTGDNIYKVLIYFDQLYGKMNDREKRQLIEELISEIQIYPERQPNGQWLKSIKFRLPIIEEDMNISLDNEQQVETVVLLTERPLVLVEPCGKYLESYLEAREEGRENGMASDDFSSAPAGELLKRYDDFRCGRDLPPGWVAADYYWLVDEDKNRFIGEIGIRHGLTEALRRYGGHIGYAVRPSEWNKGHGTLMLGLALEKARDLGITTAMITCDDDNAASARVMEKNGFTLLDRVTNTVDGRTVITRRYTKNLSPGPAGKGAV